MKTRIKVIAILFFVLAAASCDSTSKNYNYQVPAQTNDGLQVESLEKSNIDSTLIIDAAKHIERGKYGEIHSMLIYKNDKLVSKIISRDINTSGMLRGIKENMFPGTKTRRMFCNRPAKVLCRYVLE